MNILLVGGGGREHAIASALARSACNIYTIMKNKNPGIVKLSTEYLIADEKDINLICDWAVKKHIELAIIGPEAPLAAGLVDMLETHGIQCAAPSKKAAMIETSKIFMRELMTKYHIDGNVEYRVFNAIEPLRRYLQEYTKKFVIKPEGLTGGKGVKVMGDHFNTVSEGIAYASEILTHKIGGTARLLIEEQLVGEEFTLQAFCDGSHLRFMPIVQDFKRAWENDTGPNTGGMGSYSMPDHKLPFLTSEDVTKAKQIMSQLVQALKAEHHEFKGILYGQFMITATGPKVIEINARFGDPEAMNVLSILKTDFVTVLKNIVNKTLNTITIEFEHKATVVKYIVPEGYGTHPRANEIITLNLQNIKNTNAILYYAAVNARAGKIYTTTSRAIAITGVANTLTLAEQMVEKASTFVQGRVYMRHDIATPHVIDQKIQHIKHIRSHSTH